MTRISMAIVPSALVLALGLTCSTPAPAQEVSIASARHRRFRGNLLVVGSALALPKAMVRAGSAVA